MPRAKAAQRVAAANVTASLAALLCPARAEASRKNGAKSKGPTTAEGKGRSARNALKHGLRAERFVVVAGESAQAFAAFEAELIADLAPQGALQRLLAGRIARAAWRLERAERIEAELFARQMRDPFGGGDLGLALIRDGNGARAFDTLLRYRGAAQAELARALRTLKALQAEAKEAAGVAAPASAPQQELPSEPESRGTPRENDAGETAPRPGAASVAALPSTAPLPTARTLPMQPGSRGNPQPTPLQAAGRGDPSASAGATPRQPLPAGAESR